MHIIIAIIGALAGLFWAFTYFTQAAQQGKTAVDDVRSAFRRGKWSRKIDQRLIENLSDPRECAAILLYQIAIYDGALTDRQRVHLIDAMGTMFNSDSETAEGLLAFARMALGEITDAANSLRKIISPIMTGCSDQEKSALLKAMQLAAQIEAPINDQQTHLLNLTRRQLLPDA